MAEYERRSTPFHKSLIEVKSIAGVEAKMFTLNVMFTAVMTINLERLAMIGVGMLTHAYLVWETRKNPLFLDMYKQFLTEGDVYDPWPHASQRRNLRPLGFAPHSLR